MFIPVHPEVAIFRSSFYQQTSVNSWKIDISSTDYVSGSLDDCGWCLPELAQTLRSCFQVGLTPTRSPQVTRNQTEPIAKYVSLIWLFCISLCKERIPKPYHDTKSDSIQSGIATIGLGPFRCINRWWWLVVVITASCKQQNVSDMIRNGKMGT